MALSSIAGAASTAAPVRATGATTPRAASAPSSALTPAVATGFSQAGRMLASLERLASGDPQAFRTNTARMSAMLKDAASRASGSDAQWLSDMADRFASASTSGALQDLDRRTPARTGVAAAAYATPEGARLADAVKFRPELPAMWAELFSLA